MGKISNIQRMCSHDGPGIRTTVFFKGCPLRCSWCHNPEAICACGESGWNAGKCIGCGECVRACPEACIELDERGVRIDRDRCRACGECARACPSGALNWYGKDYTPEELVREITKDRVYFRNSGGGATLSGGEPLLQREFAEAVLTLLKQEGIHTAVDTCCFAEREAILSVAASTDLMLMDIKEIDPALHRRFTGADNRRILDNILAVAERSRKEGAPGIYIRTPLVPDCTLRPENILGIGRFIRENLSDVLIRWELLLFHNMCAAKYAELGREWQHRDAKPINHRQLEEVHQIVRSIGKKEDRVKISGLVLD